jgi:DHA3 family macrolide efflux protein-like MFS transporter
LPAELRHWNLTDIKLSDVNQVALARFISRTGGEAAFFVGIWGKASFEFNATPTELAWVMAALGVASLIGSAAAGLAVDRHGPRRILMLAELAFIPAVLALTLATSITAFSVLVFFTGLLSAPVYTAVASMAPFLTSDPARLSLINSRIETGSWAAFIVGPAVGALLADSVSLDSIFVFDAATSLIGVLLVLPIKLRPPVAQQERSGFLAELVSGIRYSASRPALRFMLVTGTSVWLAYGAFSALEPLFYREVLKTGPAALGWMNSLFGVGMVAGTILVPRLSRFWWRAPALPVLVALNGAAGLIYVSTDRLWVVAIGAFCWGSVIGVLSPVYRTLVQSVTPDHLMGRVQGTSQMLSDTLRLVPLLFVPALAVQLGIQGVLIGNVFVLGILGLALIPWSRRFAEVALPSNRAGR